MQDSNYTITKDIYNEIGGDPNEHFDSVYSIALAILKKMKGGKPSLQALNAVENGVYTPEGFDGYSEVTVAVPEKTFTTEEKTVEITKNGATIILKSENVDGMTKVTANVNVQPNLQEATLAVWENHKKFEIVPEANFDGISKAFVDVNVPEPVIEENKTLDITNNGSYTMTPSQDFDAIKMGTIHVDVPEKTFTTEEKTVSITSNGQTIVDKTAEVDGMTKVTIDVNVPTGGASFDWDGTGYNNMDQSIVNNQTQRDLDYTKQKFAEWDPSRTSASELYKNNTKLVYAPKIDTSNCVDISKMYWDCHTLKYVPALDTSKCKECWRLFDSCFDLEEIDENFIVPSSETSWARMFYECGKLRKLPKTLDMSNATNANSCFYSCKYITSTPQLNFVNVTSAQGCFQQCISLKSVNIINSSKVKNFSYFFSSCYSLDEVPQIDTSGATDVSYFIAYNRNTKKIPKLNFSSVTNISNFITDTIWTDDELTDLGGFTGLKIDWNDYYGGLNACPNLTKQSVLNVINELYDFRANGDASTTKTIKFHANSLALLSEDEKLIATNKGWNLVS